MTKIYIAAHKSVDLPHNEVLTPIFVGAKGKEDIVVDGYTFTRDDSGDNISDKNPYYCELTALYWAWKNTSDDAVGLMHYRRFFEFDSSVEELLGSLGAADASADKMIVPTKRKYYIESLYSHYAHTFDSAHLDLARYLIERRYPELIQYVDQAYQCRWGYMFNMFVMPRQLFEEYCTFLFDILDEMERQIDDSKLDAFNKRLYGRVSEILFTAWAFMLADKRGVELIEVPVRDMEPINWPKKIAGFLAAKFFGRKYTKSS